MFNQKCIKGELSEDGVKVYVENLKNGKTEIIEGDVCLLSTGRRPYTNNLGLENLNIKTDA